MWAHFLESDRPALEPCPVEDFALFECGTRKVHVDAHVEVMGAFHPVPLHLIGLAVQVRWDEHLVRVIADDVEVAVHPRLAPGRWALRPGRDARELTSTQQSYLEWLKRRCSDIGPELRRWAEAAHEARGIRAFKLLQGVLALGRKHSRAQMLRAAASALEQRQFRYRTFQRLAARPAPAPPERVLTTEHPAIRSMSQYSLAGFLPPASLPSIPGEAP